MRGGGGGWWIWGAWMRRLRADAAAAAAPPFRGRVRGALRLPVSSDCQLTSLAVEWQLTACEGDIWHEKPHAQVRQIGGRAE